MHAGRFAYIVRCLDAIGVSGSCLDVAGTAMTKMLFEAMSRLSAVTVADDFDVEMDDWVDRFGAGAFDVAVYSEVIEHLSADPSKSIHEINRSLKMVDG